MKLKKNPFEVIFLDCSMVCTLYTTWSSKMSKTKTVFHLQLYCVDVAEIVKSSVEDGFHLRE
jgi:hypothetical protein